MSIDLPLQTPWHTQAAQAFPHHIFLKSIGIPAFIAMFFGAYFYLLKYPVHPVTLMPITLLDRLINFQPAAVPLYVSLWVYVSLAPAFLSSRRELYVYALGMTATCLTGLLVFYFWPTAVPAAEIDWGLYPSVDFLKTMDAAGNACPSLHVATAVFTGAWLHFILRRFGAPLWLLLANSVWCIGIAYSTLATRQHVAVDMWAGLALGLITGFMSLRYIRPVSASDRTGTDTG
ncbi:MAG TPA: phosphatase PAP2 family protein [Polaromonas sp.]|uniref:phosphatase PAP2 family protein n=1 Tax=Polaromonas sp. TaxID=1869339 RepID=UPI002D27B42C|nr:phosphatase PAP2 family protein [Polaromonas sp.]HYW56505.1 phosphatase PAP2 family protein [Polaromonas sp.]